MNFGGLFLNFRNFKYVKVEVIKKKVETTWNGYEREITRKRKGEQLLS